MSSEKTKRRIWVLSMFENYFDMFTEYGVLGSAFRNERGDDLEFEFIPVSIPKFVKKGFKGVDSSPYGGGVGMIMRSDSMKDALIKGVVEAGEYTDIKKELHIVCPAPRGKTWNQDYAMDFAKKHLCSETEKDLVFICGRYEGIDERFLENYVDEFISIGDVILTGGELAVMLILDSAMRFSPGVLGNKLSAQEESFFNNRLEHALYTRPAVFEGKAAPDPLVKGHHKKIIELREKSSLAMTRKYRPDLLDK